MGSSKHELLVSLCFMSFPHCAIGIGYDLLNVHFLMTLEFHTLKGVLAIQKATCFKG